MITKGRIYRIFTPTQIESKNGGSPMIKQEFILTQDDDYETKIVFTVLGEQRVRSLSTIHEGMDVRVRFDIKAHEYNGRWYNSVNAFDVRQLSLSQDNYNPIVAGNTPHAYHQQAPYQLQGNYQQPSQMAPNNDGLPF